MSLIHQTIINKSTSNTPIWIMRQAGRYLPEFRDIRKKNPNFIKLCLNTNLCTEITLQPLKRFKLDAAIIFSDILMIPYGLDQEVKFEKNFGPILGNFSINHSSQITEEKFFNKLKPVYNTINLVSRNELLKEKNTIGFVGAPWTLLVYIINKQSPKKNIDKNFFNDDFLVKNISSVICDECLKLKFPKIGPKFFSNLTS